MEEKIILTEEQVKALKETLEGVTNKDIEDVQSLPSNNGKYFADINDNSMPEPEIKEGMVTIDPATGEYKMDDRSETEKAIDEEMARILDVKPEDLYGNMPESIFDIPINEEQVKENIKANSGNILNEEDISALLPVIDRFRRGDKTNYFNILPEKLQKSFIENCVKFSGQCNKEQKKLLAEEFLRGVIADAGYDKLVEDFQKEMNKAMDTKPLVNLLLEDQATSFEKAIDNKIKMISEAEIPEDKKEEAEQQIKTLEGVKNAYKEAYTLESFKDALRNHKIKIKKIDIDKAQKHIREFLFKYQGDTPFAIRNLAEALPVLKRFFNEYSDEYIIKFIVSFCKYCRNMNAKNVVDHTFMSYFVSNLFCLDELNGSDNPDQLRYLNTLSINIKEAICLVNEEELSTQNKA